MNILTKRNELSHKYLKGDGIEVGALHGPLSVSEDAHVRYVDRMTVLELRKHYPELESVDLVEPDIVDDGELLSSIPDASLNFIIANHMLEHCENPIGTLRSHMSKLKPGGVGYYAVPDKNFTFDSERAITTFDHLVYDDILGVSGSREQHFRDWVTYVNNKHGTDAAEYVQHLMGINYSIHFHVWDHEAFSGFIKEANAYLGNIYHIDEIVKNHDEIICVLRRPLEGDAVHVETNSKIDKVSAQQSFLVKLVRYIKRKISS